MSNVAPPAGAKIVDLSSQASGGSGGATTPAVTGLAAVQAAAPFPVVAPDTLVGLPRQDVSLVGPQDSKAAVVVYGEGLGAIVVLERAKDTAGANAAARARRSTRCRRSRSTAPRRTSSRRSSARCSAGMRAGVSFVLAGSLPSGAAESAARALK